MILYLDFVIGINSNFQTLILDNVSSLYEVYFKKSPQTPPTIKTPLYLALESRLITAYNHDWIPILNNRLVFRLSARHIKEVSIFFKNDEFGHIWRMIITFSA